MKCTLCPEYKVLCLGHIQQHITEYHSSYFQAWWWLHHVMGMLVIGKEEGVFLLDKIKWNRAKHRQNPRGKPGSVCFPTDTGRQMYLSAGQ
jgi:hypothetical protein